MPSTGVAAVLEGRNFVGVELTEHYAEVARLRIAEAAGEAAAEIGTLFSPPDVGGRS